MSQTSEQKPREFWIDDILNVDRPSTKTAYIYEQDTEKFTGKVIHVIEYSAYEQAQARIKELEFQRDYWKKQLEVLEIKNREPLATMKSTKDSI